MSSTATTLTAKIEADGIDHDTAVKLVSNLTDEQLAEALANYQSAAELKAELRTRLMNNPQLRKVVAPATDWKTSDDRFIVAEAATRLVETAAADNGLTLEELLEAMIADGDTLAESMALHGEDPRFDGHAPGQGFFAFRCRIRDGVQIATAERTAAARKIKNAADDAKWAAAGMVRCDRCGGAGGHHGWPGFTCYDCGGEGAVVA